MSYAAGLAVGPGMRVRLHFAILLAGGEEVDSTRRGAPAEFVVGDGNLPPGFERALSGLRSGDDEQLTIAAEDGFGPHHPDNVRIMPREGFPEDAAPGTVVSFAGPGGEVPGVVKEVYESTVKVDFNHPLAGQTLTFDVSILSVSLAG